MFGLWANCCYLSISLRGSVNRYFLQLFYLLAVLSADPMIQATIKDAYLGYD